MIRVTKLSKIEEAMNRSKRTWPGLKDKSPAIRAATKYVKEQAENLATILAALRLFQKTYQDKDAAAIRKEWPEHFFDLAPLGSGDIDRLCEDFNSGKLGIAIQR